MTEQDLQKEFFLWFFEKADPLNTEFLPHLHGVAVNLLGKIFSSLGKKVPVIQSVTTKQGQYLNHIRITVNEECVILLQSLSFSCPSNELLTKEVEHEISSNEMQPENLFPLFIKTKYEFSIKEGDLIYPILYRDYLMESFFSRDTRNIVIKQFLDYREWLSNAEQEFSGFRDKMPDTWGYKEWIGYSNFLEKEMNWGTWTFLPGTDGGKFSF